MDSIKLPQLFNTEEKYNQMIRETDTIEKFETIYLNLLSNEELNMSSILKLMKVIERDVILVNKLHEASLLMEMTDTFINYINMKDEKGQEVQIPEPENMEKIGKDTTKKTQKEEEDKHSQTTKTRRKTVKTTYHI